MNKTLNLISFKIGWALCIWAAIQHQPIFSWLASFALLTINISVQKKRRIALAKVILVLVFGFLFETINHHLGFYYFPQQNSFLPPSWLLAFWPVFALLFIDFMEIFDSKPLWFHFLIGITGALGYYCGEWAQLLYFHQPLVRSLSLFSIVWAMEYVFIVKATLYVGRQSFLQG